MHDFMDNYGREIYYDQDVEYGQQNLSGIFDFLAPIVKAVTPIAQAAGYKHPVVAQIEQLRDERDKIKRTRLVVESELRLQVTKIYQQNSIQARNIASELKGLGGKVTSKENVVVRYYANAILKGLEVISQFRQGQVNPKTMADYEIRKRLARTEGNALNAMYAKFFSAVKTGWQQVMQIGRGQTISGLISIPGQVGRDLINVTKKVTLPTLKVAGPILIGGAVIYALFLFTPIFKGLKR